MEGLLDFVLRDILTRVGGIDRCVSEFIRVTNTVLPERVFLRIIPELANGGRTLSGVPVRGQLLGSDPHCLAENAARLASMGPDGIDLNFGCPAKLVNRHGGGAALLDQPELMLAIVAAVRRAVPSHLPVSAKMRLGFADDSRAEECALALQEGGACEIVVHARTKADAYRPPAYWSRVADIKRLVKVPIIANGEIWTREDALQCQTDSNCQHLMLGRGMVANPGLAREIAGDMHTLSWAELLPLVRAFWELVVAQLEPRQHAGRLKQWLNFLRRVYPQAQVAYDQVRTLVNADQVDLWFAQQPAAKSA
jgi:tRNA-dihydrouridine synthase C